MTITVMIITYHNNLNHGNYYFMDHHDDNHEHDHDACSNHDVVSDHHCT